eukprot:tig00000555_g2134.t1
MAATVMHVPVLQPEEALDPGEAPLLPPAEPAVPEQVDVPTSTSSSPGPDAPAAAERVEEPARARSPPAVDPSPRKPVMRTGSMLGPTKYKYIVLPGNNSSVVREQLEKRPWWEPTADHDTLFNLKWKQTVANIRWDLMNSDPRVKQAVNHLEFNRVICTKSGLARTLRTYADKVGIDCATMTPLTFVVEHVRDAEWHAFTSYVRLKLAKGGEDPPNPQSVALQQKGAGGGVPRAASPARRQRSRSPTKKPSARGGGLGPVAAAAQQAAATAAAAAPAPAAAAAAAPAAQAEAARPATPSAPEAGRPATPSAPAAAPEEAPKPSISAASVVAAQQQRARAAARTNAAAAAAAAGGGARKGSGAPAAPAAQPRARSAKRSRRRPSARARSAPASARGAGEEGEEGSGAPAPAAGPAMPGGGLDSIAEKRRPPEREKERPVVLPPSGSILRAGNPGGAFNNANIGLWIVKPSHLNRGNGIELFTTVEEVENHVNRFPGVWIIQRYIERPLLIHKRKFDFRIYALITGTMDLYVYKEGYIRTSSAAYNTENTVDKYIHLTNNAVQKKGAEYGAFEEGNQLSFDDFQRYLDEQHADAGIDFRRDLFAKMLEHIKTSFLASRKLLNLSGRRHCFEVFGYDFMLDEDFNVLLIEVNTNPCLELSSALLRSIIPQMLDDAFRLTLDVTFPPPRGARRTVPAPENRFLCLHRSSDPAPGPGGPQAPK